MQLFYFLHQSKKLTKYLWKFDQHYLKIETIFMNTENSKTNELRLTNLFISTDKLTLKTPNNKKYWIG